jgi:endo-1,4-beta-xylanase
MEFMYWILLLIAVFCALPMHAGEATALPAGGRLLSAAIPTLRNAVERASTSIVAVEGLPFAQALRISVRQAGQPWEVEGKVPVPVALTTGETLLIRLWLRAVHTRAESGDVTIGVNLQKSGPDWYKPFNQGISANRDWREVLLPFTLDRDFPASGAELALHLGDREQELELGGVEVWSFGTKLKPSQLPRMRITWAGMEPDAPWRAEAEARIERLRKGDLTVRVIDAAGKPVAGAAVRVRQLRHAFPFGTAATAGRIMGTQPDDEIYRRHLRELFNAVVLENDLKWGAWAGEWGPRHGRTQTLAALGWLREHDYLVRGHVLVWPSWRNLPKSVEALKGDPAALRQAILARIDDAAGATSGLVAHWDVLNEPFDNHDVMDLCGRDVMVEWFTRARQRLPADCRLFINDYGIVAAGGATDTPHQRHYAETIRFLLDQGAPLEGIGVQSHFGGQPTPPAAALAILDRFAAFKLPILVTEFDINTQDEDYQAAYTRDYLTLCFSHPGVSGFLMWGFWEGAHWLPQAAMMRKDWSEKPNLAVWRELVLRRWWSDLTAHTDADGVARVRGFKGTYTVDAAGRTAAASIGDQPVEVTLQR